MIARSEGYQPHIDGLRALAVLAVILNHFSAGLLPSGFLGVDVFFVISGVVITASLSARGPYTSVRQLLLGFYSRRVKRLLPALIFCVVVTAVAVCAFDPQPQLSLQTGMAALFGGSNLLLFGQATDYFARDSALNAFTQTWSLGVEEQFYLLYPLLIWVCGFRRAGQTGGSRRLFAVIAVASLLSLMSFWLLVGRQPAAAYFLMPCRFWEMGAGGLLWLALQRPGLAARLAVLKQPRWALAAPGLLVAVLILPRGLQALTTPAVVLLSGALIVAGQGTNPTGRLLRLPAAVALGRLSYSLYLWHWSVLVLSRWTIGIQWWTVPLQLAAMLLLAIGSTRWLEEPLRQARWSPWRWATIGLGLGTSLLAMLPVWAMSGPLHSRLYLGRPRGGDGLLDGGPLRVEGTDLDPPHCSTDRLDAAIFASPEGFANKVERCTARAPLRAGMAQPPQLWTVGDSHAMPFLPMLDRLHQEGAMAVTLLARPGCPFPVPASGTVDPNCSRFQQLVEERILSTARPGDVVTILGYHLGHFGDEGQLKDTRRTFLDAAGRPLPSGQASLELYLQTLNGFAERAGRRGVRTLLIGAGPRNPLKESCDREWFNVQPTAPCERQVQRELANARELNRTIATGLSPQILWLDPLPILCAGVCTNRQVSSSLLRDRDHLTSAAVLRLEAAFRALIRQTPSARLRSGSVSFLPRFAPPIGALP